MGTLRTLLAITVVFAHTNGPHLVGGKTAVQLFYMISGFLISYILIEKKSYTTIKSFYINRYLRIYPIYLAIAITSLFLYTLVSTLYHEPPFFYAYKNSPITAKILLIFANTTIFLQDWVMFSGIQHGDLVFTTNFRDSDILLFQALLAPQSWTLGIELTFYLIAPFILGKRKFLLIILSLSILLRIWLIWLGFGNNDPWTYRFFPTEIAVFLIGALAHQELLPIYKKLASKNIKISAKFATFFLIFTILIFDELNIKTQIKETLLLLIFALLLPLAFKFQENNKTDKLIGELSYPIYICHILVSNFIKIFIIKPLPTTETMLPLLTTIFSILFSIALIKYISNPVETLRSRIKCVN